ncbi:HSP20 family protein [Thermosporothrix hazakensis]|jgi:HSP20 family protein|uniref:HSP20 family protein n=2 Tax=Thermosporothrix TaxID=768650 RepID=A0A326U7R7_THEHA|nr:Hsp20/alpha crystallin family protein [Thermosporothrix hazakensis]PZW22382.1 HSP20 family protein [Thermosporothrix hazakensis]BBH91084.1 hypothetical protein KTC_58350 [Thermosporothrix sp. COM3]GCE49136.1 hypothetical protein KTH_40050 [Thermosporothrix hazakensis]
MAEKLKVQHVPLKIYRSTDRLMVAVPMPGLEPEDIQAEVTDDNRLILQGELRGSLKEIKELLLDEWSVGGYYREVTLPDNVDAERANLSYGNGVFVLTFPLSGQTVPARLTMEKVGVAHGQRSGNAGQLS